MQTILIPTDFNPSALKCIPNLCQQFKNEELNLIFIHMFKLSDSITDLLMLSRRSKEYERVSPDFYRDLNGVRGNFPSVKSVRIEFFYGSTVSMFRNFLEANEVSFVLDPADCSISKINRSSIDPAPLITKCGLPVVRLQPCEESELSVSEKSYTADKVEELVEVNY